MDEDKRTPLTKEAFQRLQAELAQLEGEARQRIIDAIAVARAHGDLSENAEYHAAKDQQGLQEARVRQIKEMLESADIIEADEDRVVKPGKLVTIASDGEDPETYLIGLREEKGGEHDVLTPESPLGRALLGHAAGDRVIASVPAGELAVEIVEIRSP